MSNFRRSGGRGHSRGGSSLGDQLKQVPERVWLIESRADLEAYAATLAPGAPIALDTEFIGERTYIPDLQIVQAFDGIGHIAVIDLPAVGDLKPLAGALADPTRDLILHDARQDAILLARHGAPPVAPVFDTQLAAALLGLGAQQSLRALAESFAGARLEGSQTVSDWSRRPLTPAQIAYCGEDVEHLPTIRAKLLEKLQRRGRLEWLREEQANRVAEWLSDQRIPDEDRYRAVAHWGRLRPRELAVLRELAAWREREARGMNLSRRLLITDDALVTLARMAPTTADELAETRHVPPGVISRYRTQLLDAIKRGRETPQELWPTLPVREHAEIPVGVVELLQALVRSTAESQEIAPTLLATTDDLKALAARAENAEQHDLDVLRGWRRALIGEKLLALLDGKQRLRIKNRRELVIEDA